ncbi:hypothetical protein CMI47_00635 [Candidatus Pacearchaeota archaeon]|nr:hypothetical protein [Candidatus Pacearchaeota archaeon]|tara:strand:- start:542 stop:856 length:315 start_codon:yes stop_codon:yes gene_type:complete
MPDEIPQAPQQDQYFSDLQTRLRDIEEKQSLVKDRTLLIGQTLVEQREKSFSEIQQMKKELIVLKEDNKRMKALLSRLSEQISATAKSSDLDILQRQFDLFRKT